MAMGNIRWKYVLLWASLVLCVLTLGSYCYKVYGLERPLEKRLLEDADVLMAQVEKAGGTTTVVVHLKYVDNLAQTYSRLEHEVRKALGTRGYEIVVRDNPDEALEGAYGSIHYYIEEARIRGNFGEMAHRSRAALEHTGIDDFRLTVDGDNIFVQMRSGDKYLYRVKDLYAEGGTGF
ncbi:MAG TPA: hypothetical protein PK309_01315 [Bacillota bacterium]|nr:hypothetical protein [Bacillota bacterium]